MQNYTEYSSCELFKKLSKNFYKYSFHPITEIFFQVVPHKTLPGIPQNVSIRLHPEIHPGILCGDSCKNYARVSPRNFFIYIFWITSKVLHKIPAEIHSTIPLRMKGLLKKFLRHRSSNYLRNLNNSPSAIHLRIPSRILWECL